MSWGIILHSKIRGIQERKIIMDSVISKLHTCLDKYFKVKILTDWETPDWQSYGVPNRLANIMATFTYTVLKRTEKVFPQKMTPHNN